MSSPSGISTGPALVEPALLLPQTLNLQAIDLCNSRCIMCNIWKDGRRERLTLEQFRQELAGPFYREVRHVGVTGGEPTLRKDLFELYELLPQCLPKLTGASFITHGMQTGSAVECYARVHRHYRALKLDFNGMVSLDGVGTVHDQVRGRKGAFDAASKTLLQLRANGVGAIAACTIVRTNVYGLHDLLDWGKANGVYVRFRVAEFIRRLYNDSCASEIRGFSPRELRHLVSFFHLLLGEYETDESIRKTYTSILSLLTGGERLTGCPFQKGLAVNVDSRGWLACCAPKSDSFQPAGLAETNSTLVAQRHTVAQAHCANCIHDYHDDWNPVAAREVSECKARQKDLYELSEENLTTPELPAEPFDLAGMKKVLLAGWYGTETAGDIAILQGIVSEYLAQSPELKFEVLSFHPYYTRTTVALWPDDLRTRVSVIGYDSEAAWQATLDCDAIVMAGGPLMDISETRKVLCLFKRFADLAKPRVIEGCGVGPLNRLDCRWNVTRIARLATKISVRDQASRDHLRSYGIRKPVEVRPDPAVAFIRSQGVRHHGADGRVIRCFFRELTGEYPQATTSAQASQNLVTLLRNLLAWYPEHRIELWAMHHFPVGMDDRLFARELVKQIADPRLVCDWEPRTPREILEAMAAADFCVCMRFHSCVFATEVGVPFMAIDYTAGGKIKAFFDDLRQPSRLCILGDLPRLDQNQFEAKRNLPPVAGQESAEAASMASPSRSPLVLHIIQNLIGGGGARAMVSLAKHSGELGEFRHQLVSLAAADEVGLELAKKANLPVLDHPSQAELKAAMARADIVLVHWWNNPDLARLFRRELPPMRLALWIHVGGYHPPQVLQPSLIPFADLTVACSPHTYAHPAFATLPDEVRQQHTAMVLAGAEFDRLQELQPRAHQGFRIGYIGTLAPFKMHPDFVNLCCSVNLPDAKFVICGGGDSRWLTDQVGKLGRGDTFDFLGHVEDIRSVLESLDVYGYPLCPETYAAAELNLQEVMYAGVPVVAFPYGGIGKLIQNGETGILVNTAEEYARAIEHLHQNPSERARLGANAAAFARRYWGAENAAREFNTQFEKLLKLPKRTRQWGVSTEELATGLPPSLADHVPQLAVHPGARLFVESLEAAAKPFLDSLTAAKLDAIVAAEDQIARISSTVRDLALIPYRDAHPKDPFLQLWVGLGLMRSAKFQEAFESFTAAWQNGFNHMRVHWYRAIVAEQAGRPADAVEALTLLLKTAPHFAPAKEMRERLGRLGVGQTTRPAPAQVPTSVAGPSPVSPVTAEPLIKLAKAALGRNDRPAAVSALEQARKNNPRHPGVLIALGNLYCESGHFSASLDVLRQALSCDAKNPSIHVSLARAFVQLNQIAEFQAALGRALEINPGFIPAHRLLGDLLLDQKQYSLAEKHYRRALDQAPADVSLLLSLAECVEQAGDLTGAVTTRQEAARLARASLASRETFALLESLTSEIRSVAARPVEMTPAAPSSQSPAPFQTNSSVTATCPICHIAAPGVVVKREHQYHLCPSCNCVFTPRLNQAMIKTENNGHSGRHDQNQDAVRLQRLIQALGQRPGQLIDFGCGQGETTRFLQSQGIQTVGIDQDTPVQLKDVAAGSVDGIMMVEVIEHLYEPNPIFQQFNRVLKTGGVAYIESSFADQKDLAAWPYLDPAIGHCTVHTLRSMAIVAEKNGFKVQWLNANVCCFTKVAVVVAGNGEKPVTPAPVEVIGEGIPDPVVSVVVSTYQAEKFIRPCLDGLVRQKNFGQCEVIVVDSGSPENERAIVLEFQQKYPNIRYVRTERETLYGAWNRGLALARGRYWVNANTDDALRDDALEMLAAALEKHDDCALAYADTVWTTKPNDCFPSANITKTVKYPHYSPLETLFYCITACLQFWRTDRLRQLGGFDASLRAAGDYEATIKLMAGGLNAVHVPEVLSLFYQNTAGITQGDSRSASEHQNILDRSRASLDIANIFEVQSGDAASAALAWTALAIYATKFTIPWEDKPSEHCEFAFDCFHKALELDPENDVAGMNLVALHIHLDRLNPKEAELVGRWPKMRQWIDRMRSGEPYLRPNVNHAVLGPVYRPFEHVCRPTEEQMLREPEALRPWICRIDGRHVYLSEDVFPRPAGLNYKPEELQAGARRLATVLAALPPFYAHFGGAGDALLLLASFYDQKPDAVLFSHPNGIGAAKALFDAFPKLSKVYFLPQHAEPFFHIVARYMACELKNCLGAGTTPKDNYEEEWKAGLDIVKKYRIKKAPRWAAEFRQNNGSRRVAVAPKGSLSGMVGSKRNIILPEQWSQIIAHIIDRGFEPVILGLPNEAMEYPALPGCVDARRESFPGQMKIIGQSAGLVGADSWAKTFSALAQIPTVVFEPIKGADLCSWKDASDWVFIEPWPAIKMVKSLDAFRQAFDTRIAKISAEPPPAKAVVAWEGSFLDYGSLSHVNRELTSRLAGELSLTCVGPNAMSPKVKADPEMQRCARLLVAKPPTTVAVTVRHQWPPNWSRPAQGKLVVIQPWEYGVLPKSWVANEKNVDEFWVPSPLVRSMYLDSGIAPEKVRVVPNGVDLKKFRPGVRPLALPTKKKFKFLFVGGTIFRKGPDILLEAFTQAFTAADDVCLVIKDFGGDSFYKGQTAESAIHALRQKPGAPEIVYLKDELASDQMPSLYVACDCFVLPYRGEGFGMPVLEAMACGLPVIVTARGATDSFVSSNAGWKIPSRGLIFGENVGDIPLVKNGWMLDPIKPQLVAILKEAAANPMECRKRGTTGRSLVEKRFDWGDISAMVAHRLKELAADVPVPAVAAAAQTQTTATASAKRPLPEVAHIGRLAEARELFTQKKLPLAWEAAVTAIAHRPFHPEAFLLLAEIARAAGDAKAARQCAQYARDIAPVWDAPKQFLKKPLKGSNKCDWLVLPLAVNSQLSTPNQRLTVCLIAKNEEKFLAQCLKSVRDLAHQIVVVDTGSTDRTVEIAREFNAEVYSHPWNDDFSAARNVALTHATGDWVLVLDADEELPEAQHAKLLADLNKSDSIAHRLPLVNAGDENEGCSYVPRLYRNAPGIFYHGRIHEQVFPSLLPMSKAWGLRTTLGTAELLHHGYSKELLRDRNKIERNLKLLRLAVAENPADVNLAMNLGLELVRSDDFSAGVEQYRKAYEMMTAQPPGEVVPELSEALLTQFTSQLYKVPAFAEVVDVLNSPLAKKDGLTASQHFALGLAYFELKQFSEAADQMRQCIAKRRQPALTPINTAIHTAAPQHCLALSLARLGDHSAAEQAFAAALAEPGPLDDVKKDYAKFLADTDRQVDALKKLNEIVAQNPRHAASWSLGGKIALSRREYLKFARDWTGEALKVLPGNPVVAAQRAEALMLNGDTAAALELWEKLWDHEHSPAVLAALILCEVIEKPSTHAPNEGPDESQTSREFINWYQRLLKLQSRPMLERVNEQLEKLARALPTAAKMIEAALAEPSVSSQN